jgi:DNA-binding NtrC family response regulator
VTEPQTAPELSAAAATDDLASLQRSKVVSVLRRVQGNKSHAAKTMGIERRKLYRLLEKYSITDAEIAGVQPAANPSEAEANV